MSSAGGIVYIVDASPYIYKAYHSYEVAEVQAPCGRPANAVYGFTCFLMELIKDHQPGHLAITFDRFLSATFRNELYPPYKGHRDLPPPDLESQLDWCIQMAQAMGVATFIHDELEADDLIAGIHRNVQKTDERIVIITPDKDMAQLVDSTTTLWDHARDVRYDEAGVIAKFGVRPDQIVDYLGLAGDSADNIPGVKGVGPKIATALLAEFGDLGALFDDLDRVATLTIRGAKTLGAKLEAQRDAAFLSRRLATVVDDVPDRLTLDELRLQRVDAGALEPLLATLGFGRLRYHLER